MSRSTTPPGWPMLAVCFVLIYGPIAVVDFLNRFRRS